MYKLKLVVILVASFTINDFAQSQVRLPSKTHEPIKSLMTEIYQFTGSQSRFSARMMYELLDDAVETVSSASSPASNAEITRIKNQLREISKRAKRVREEVLQSSSDELSDQEMQAWIDDKADNPDTNLHVLQIVKNMFLPVSSCWGVTLGGVASKIAAVGAGAGLVGCRLSNGKTTSGLAADGIVGLGSGSFFFVNRSKYCRPHDVERWSGTHGNVGAIAFPVGFIGENPLYENRPSDPALTGFLISGLTLGVGAIFGYIGNVGFHEQQGHFDDDYGLELFKDSNAAVAELTHGGGGVRNHDWWPRPRMQKY
jgi:hypothetical protein